MPSPRPTVGGIIGGGSAALAAIIALGYMGLVQAEEMAEATVVVLLTVSHAHLTHRSFSVSHQRLRRRRSRCRTVGVARIGDGGGGGDTAGVMADWP